MLANDPVRVLLASAFFVTGASAWLAWFVLFSALAAPVEHRLGSARTIAVFALGHIGATLATAVGLWFALRGDLVESSVVHAIDVGASYGFVALAGVATYLLPRRLRFLYLGLLLLALVAALLLVPSFTDFGHLTAFLIGLACKPLVPAARDRGEGESA